MPGPVSPAAAASLGHHFFPLLFSFHLYALHFPLTLLVFDAPFGKFALDTKVLNFPGNAAWMVMESGAPISLLSTLYTYGGLSALPQASKIIVGVYLLHYFHRTITQPFTAPKRARIHLVVILAGILFTSLNSTLIARYLVTYPPEANAGFYARLVIWCLGFAGNVYHDEILHDLRRAPADRVVSAGILEDKAVAGNGRYKIPRGGMFGLISYPNYFCEWIEWTGLALATGAPLLISTPPFASCMPAWTAALAAFWPSSMLTPPWLFVVVEVVSMLPRAIRGHRWYQRTFEAYPPERRAVIPWVL